jgi:hypothetical protein
MRKPNSQTHQACRSLLQKAVRRGDASLASKIAQHLREVGDNDWIRMRTATITFEECWPLGNNLHLAVDFKGNLNALICVAKAIKVKDAAGLGVLAYTLSEGDSSVLTHDVEDVHIQRVCEAIRNPQDFWIWAKERCLQEDQRLLVESSLKAYRRGGWPWDRALIQAAAYLAVINGVSSALSTEDILDVPFWVGLDKHTPQGKKAFQHAAKDIGVSAHQLSWVSFYFESARLNESTKSDWWSRECQWRLNQIGLTYDEALLLWDKAKPVLIQVLSKEADLLEMHLAKYIESEIPVGGIENLRTQQEEFLFFTHANLKTSNRILV